MNSLPPAELRNPLGTDAFEFVEYTGRARRFAEEHGPSACAMAFRVKNSATALRSATANGAMEIAGNIGPMELKIPAIEGIGGSGRSVKGVLT